MFIGVPYDTHMWQVADSEEQNVRFTNEFADAKKDLLKISGTLALDAL